MAWLFLIFFLGATLNNLAEANLQKKLPSAVVVGTVSCDTCFQQDLFKNSHFISGATVAVECKDENARPSFHQEVKTDEHGEFKVQLPFSVGKHLKSIKRCSVKLISSSEPYCAASSRATSSSLHLKSRKQGEHIFSAGFFTFKPENQPDICSQKPSIHSSNQLNSEQTSKPSIPAFGDSTFPPPLQDPPSPDNQFHLPSLPGLPPLPHLPPFPSLPWLSNLLPMPGKTKGRKTLESSKFAQFSDRKDLDPNAFFPMPQIFPPNPFQPPPLLPPIFPQPPPLLPPIFPQPPPLLPPIFPQPPPLLPPIFPKPPPLFPPILPPIPFQPPPSPLIPLPPLPGLTPPPPPPPSFPFPLPPFPIPPLPFLPSPPPPRRFPWIPPVSSFSSSSSLKPSP